MKRKLPNLIKICGIDFNIKYFDHTADVDEDGFDNFQEGKSAELYRKVFKE